MKELNFDPWTFLAIIVFAILFLIAVGLLFRSAKLENDRADQKRRELRRIRPWDKKSNDEESP